jgi:hypothetical protein
MINTPRRRGSIFALILILAGVLLFLDNLGLLPIQNIRAYWPLLPIAWALAVIERRRGAHAIIRASAVIVFGGLLLLGNLHVIHMTTRLFAPLLLIYLGIIILIRGGERTCPWPPRRFGPGSSLREPRFSGNKVMESAVFSGSEWRVESLECSVRRYRNPGAANMARREGERGSIRFLRRQDGSAET